MFQAKLRSDTLKGVVDVVSTLIDEAKFKIGENGIQLKAVDPAHVAMVDLNLSKEAFEQYSATETDLGLDLEKLKEVIRLSRSGDIIDMRHDVERGRLVITVGNVTRRMNLVSTEGMSDPKVPNITLPARITIAVDARRNPQMPSGFELVISGGNKPVGKDAIEWAKRCEDLGAGCILPTSMDGDGTLKGYDIEFTRAVADAVSVPVVASGGAGKLEDFYAAVVEGGADILLAASVFHFRTFSIRQVKEFLKGKGLTVTL